MSLLYLLPMLLPYTHWAPEGYNILADSDPALAKFSIRGETVVREFNVVYLKYADMGEKIRLFFGKT